MNRVWIMNYVKIYICIYLYIHIHTVLFCICNNHGCKHYSLNCLEFCSMMQPQYYDSTMTNHSTVTSQILHYWPSYYVLSEHCFQSVRQYVKIIYEEFGLKPFSFISLAIKLRLIKFFHWQCTLSIKSLCQCKMSKGFDSYYQESVRNNPNVFL